MREPHGAGSALARLSRFFAGDDVFVSYARADATGYALELANELTRQKLSCFVDLWGTQPGQELPPGLQQRIRRSSLLVVVASPAAARSDSIRREIDVFLPTGRPIVPIDVDGALAAASWYPSVVGIASSREAHTHLASGTPSPEVLRRIVNAEGFKARNTRLRQTLWAVTGAIVAIVGIGALAGWWIVSQANDRLRVAQQEKERAEQGAARADRQRMASEQRATAADTLRQTAELEAQSFRTEARTQQEQAQRQQRLARAFELSSESQLLSRRSPSLLAESMVAALAAANEAISLGMRSVEVDAALRNGLAMLPRVRSMFPLDPSAGRVLLSANGRYVAIERGASIDIRTSDGARNLGPIRSQGRLAGVSNDGRRVVFAASNGVVVADAATGVIVRKTVAFDSDPTLIAISPDLRYAFTRYELWDIERGVRAVALPRERGLAPAALGYGPDGRSLIAGGAGVRDGNDFGYAQVWRLPDSALRAGTLSDRDVARYRLELFETPNVDSVAVDPAGARIAIGMNDAVTFWRVPDGRQPSETGRWPVAPVTTVAFVDDTDTVAVVSGDRAGVETGTVRRTVAVIDTEGHQQVSRIQLRGQISSMAFTTSGPFLIVGTSGGLKVWEIDGGTFARSKEDAAAVDPETRRKADALVNQRGTVLVSGRSVRQFVWNDLVGTTLHRPTPQDASDPFVAEASNASVALVVRRNFRSEEFTAWPTPRPGRPALESATSHNRQWQVTLHDKGALTLRSAAGGASSGRALQHPGERPELLFSPRDTFVVAMGGAEDNRGTAVMLWHVESGAAERIDFRGPVHTLAFSPSERYLAAATEDGIVHVRAVGGREIATLSHGEFVTSLAFSADERLLASGGTDRAARVWEIASGSQVVDVRHQQQVSAVDFSADGKYLATASDVDGDDFGLDDDSYVVRVFALRLEDLRAESCARLSAWLTATEPRPSVRARVESVCDRSARAESRR